MPGEISGRAVGNAGIKAKLSGRNQGHSLKQIQSFILPSICLETIQAKEIIIQILIKEIKMEKDF